MAEQDPLAAELPLDGAGARLRRAREAKGMSRADVAALTRIAERHIISIEEGRFSDLAGNPYAIGFSRTYARAVGLDEAEIAQDVRETLSASGQHEARMQPSFEPGDPARIPATGVAWIAALGALVVAVLVLLLWPSQYSPSVSLPDLTSEPEARASAASAVAAATPGVAAPAADPRGIVVLTATAPLVWVKVYDSAGNQLFQKEMAQGERWQLPPDAQGPMIRTARPDAIAITVGGRPVAPLADRQVAIRDVPISAAALLARPPAGATPASTTPASAGPADTAPVRAPGDAALVTSAQAATSARRVPPQPRAPAAQAASPAPQVAPAPAPAAPPAAAQTSTVSE